MSFFVLFHKVTHRPTQMERSQGDEELQLTVNSLIMEKLHDFFTFFRCFQKLRHGQAVRAVDQVTPRTAES